MESHYGNHTCITANSVGSWFSCVRSLNTVYLQHIDCKVLYKLTLVSTAPVTRISKTYSRYCTQSQLSAHIHISAQFYWPKVNKRPCSPDPPFIVSTF